MDYFIEERLNILLEKLKNAIYTEKICPESISYALCDYKKGHTPPSIEEFKPLLETKEINQPDTHYWIHFSVDTPALENKDNELVLIFKSTVQDDRWWISGYPQGILYINGELIQGTDANHEYIKVEENSHLDVYVYCYNSYEVSTCFNFNVCVAEKDIAIKDAYYDIFTSLQTAQLFDPKNISRVKILKALEKVHNETDLNASGLAFRDAAKRASKVLSEELFGEQDTIDATVHAIGHTHIDVAWLWTLAQTREKAQRTFSTMIRLMEKYDKFKFMSSQPQLYQFLKEEAPEIYAEVKKRIAEGRWESEGAMWLEADCNLSSGESLIRQIIHGKRFMKEEFGVDNKILWLPDVFGYSAALPQILKKCGVENFVTSKISWNETNMMPYDTFMWQGIDGSEVFTNFLTTQEYMGNAIRTGVTYNGRGTPTQALGSYNRYQQKEYNSNISITYGWGDGGGGPDENMIEMVSRMEKGIPGLPKVKFSCATDWIGAVREEFFESAKALRRMPRWVGELYLEFHRGTYTSIAKNKKYNRRAEFMMMKLEALAESCRRLFGADYTEEEFYSMWQTILLLQFHDIIPGSSIKPVYDDTDKIYAELFEKGEKIEKELNEILSANISGGNVIFNGSGVARGGLIKTENGVAETREVPAFGWKTLKDCTNECSVILSGNTCENEFYKLTLDKSGAIASIYDKKNAREVISEGSLGNVIKVYEDYPRQYDNWELCNYHEFKSNTIEAEKIEAISDGSRAGFKVTYKYEDSIITQNIYLYSTLKRIDFETEINWQNHHRALKTEFPLSIHTNTAKYEIQYGNVDRPTHRNTSWDAAKFEVCAHKWVDLSENGYGVSMLNDCKYGFSAEGNCLRLTMLKSGTYPNEEADIGEHSFVYSLLPHSGNDWMGETISQAYSLNQPLTVLETKQGEAEQSFVSVDKSNVVVEAIKKAYDSDATVIRLYEAENSRGDIRIKLAFDVKKAYLCDMLENEICELELDGNEILTHINNFEILTIKAI